MGFLVGSIAEGREGERERGIKKRGSFSPFPFPPAYVCYAG